MSRQGAYHGVSEKLRSNKFAFGPSDAKRNRLMQSSLLFTCMYFPGLNIILFMH